MSDFRAEVSEMAAAMAEAARLYPGKVPAQATVPGAALLIIEASVGAAPETREAVIGELMSLMQRLRAQGDRS